MIQITELELASIKDTLERIQDEADTVAEYCDTVFNSGALEGIKESLEIINSLLDYSLKEQLEEMENENDEASSDS